MKGLIKHSFLLIFCSFVSRVLAQPDQHASGNSAFRAIHYGIEEGLNRERWHTAFLKDIHGFLWLGSSHAELARFDGLSFQHFYPDDFKPGAIRSVICLGLIEDSLNNIWIGTHRGLSRYDIRADTFTNIESAIEPDLEDMSVVPFWTTSNRLFAVESGIWISEYDIISYNKRRLYKILPEDQVAAYSPAVSSIIFDSLSNSIWMLRSSGEGLVQLDLSSSKVIQHLRADYKKSQSSYHQTTSEAMCYDPGRHCIWINSHDGLIQFTLNDFKYHQIQALKKYVDLKDYDRWVGIDIDPKGRIWLATMPRGILMYDPWTQSVEIPLSDIGTQREVAESNLTIYCDREGIVWTSYWAIKGIYQLVPYSPVVQRYSASQQPDSISSLTVIGNMISGDLGDLWIGTPEGLNIYDPYRGTFKVLKDTDLPPIKGNSIAPMVINALNSKIWINAGPEDRVYEMNMNTHQCKNIVLKDTANQILKSVNIINYLSLPYKGGMLFYDAGHGIFELSGDSQVAHLVIPLKGLIVRLCLGKDSRLFLDAPGRLNNLTYSLSGGQWIKTPHFMDSVFWSAMFYDPSDQTYWVGLLNQLVHFDKDFKEIRRYSKEGENIDVILTILSDGKGNIWFNTSRQHISRLHIKTGIITTLSESEGYYKQPYDFFCAQGKEHNGELYFVGNILAPGKIGLDRVSPDKLETAPPSSVYIKSLKVNHQAFPLPVQAGNKTVLSLRYNENWVSFETGIINHFSNGKARLRYKLEGSGMFEEWQYGSYYFTIRYEGLTPGDYRLVMQASNAADEFNGPETIWHIVIKPPFWNTWWFRILATLFGFGCIVGLIQYRARNLLEKNIVLERKIEERTSELNNSLTELKSTQDQLIQSEKMASLGELTSGIAHEIKNPLNFINNFSEINLELITEVEEEPILKSIEPDQSTIFSLLKNLRKNSEKINLHGKRVDSIVKGMLQHSRLGNSVKEPININTLCDETVKLAYHGYRSKEKTFNASLETRYAPEQPKVLGVPQDIGRVIMNIINNALYAVHEKKRNLESGALSDKLVMDEMYKPSVLIITKLEDQKVSISISDNGMGIPQNIVSKIFQPFFTTKPTGEGTGLGLSMAYDIITKVHGGELRVKSKEGIGTDFEIVLAQANS